MPVVTPATTVTHRRIVAVSERYHRGMAMTLRLTDDERAALQARAAAEGISMQEAARRAVREYVERAGHRDRVATAAERITAAHADALDRLGQ
jgi:plasmid stability protein